MSFGERLRQLRKNYNLTQADLGKLIGVSDRIVGYYEMNDRFPKKAETLQKLSRALNVSADFLIGNRPFNKPTNVILDDIKAIFADDKLSEEDMDEFFRVFAFMYFESKKHKKKIPVPINWATTVYTANRQNTEAQLQFF